jgi:hypothetical protein
MPGRKTWAGENAPDGTALAFYLPQAGAATLTITNTATNEVFRTIDVAGTEGLNRLQWNLRGNPPPAPPEGARGGRGGGGGGGGGGRGGGGGGPAADAGVYRVTLTVGGREVGSATFSVLEDVWMR